MKLKYYMRGLGIGIVFTVLVYTLSGQETMTDDEIRAEAKKLGMVEASAEPGLLDKINGSEDETAAPKPSAALKPTAELEVSTEPTVTPTAEPETSTEPTAAPTAEPEVSTEPTAAPTAEPEVSTEPTATPRPTKQPEPTAAPKPTKTPKVTPTPTPAKGTEDKTETDEEYVYLTISKGMSSNQVATLAEEKGLVVEAKKFDKYLMDNGYADRIRINTYKIRLGADFKEIAECIITLQPWSDPKD